MVKSTWRHYFTIRMRQTTKHHLRVYHAILMSTLKHKRFRKVGIILRNIIRDVLRQIFTFIKHSRTASDMVLYF